MADAARARKVADRIKTLIAAGLDPIVKDPDLGFVTITDVRVTNDLQHASVFYTVFGDEDQRAKTSYLLETNRGRLRSHVGKQLGIRLTPTLEFIAGTHRGPWYMPRTFLDDQAKWFPDGSLAELPDFTADPDRWRVIGWALDRTLEDQLTIAALRMALTRRTPAPGLVHHSDRGVQYASQDYTDLLKGRGINISMSRKGNPYDNAACESFMKTLKYEEVFRSEYRDLQEAHRSIREFLEKIYNEKRLHSALGYLPPTEFEANLAAQQNEAATRRIPV